MRISVQYKPNKSSVIVRFMGLTKHRGIKVPCGRLEYVIRKNLYGDQ